MLAGRRPDFFWISGLSMVGAVQQTVQSPQSRPGISVMPSHMARPATYNTSPPSIGE